MEVKNILPWYSTKKLTLSIQIKLKLSKIYQGKLSWKMSSAKTN